MFAGDLAAAGPVVAWTDQMAVWAQVGDGPPQLVADEQRNPHGLSADGRGLVWVESEADLLPGRPSGSFYAEHDGERWSVQRLPLSLWGEGAVLRDRVLYGSADCVPVGAAAWVSFDLGEGGPPVAVGTEHFYWVRWDFEAQRSEIVSAPRSACGATGSR